MLTDEVEVFGLSRSTNLLPSQGSGVWGGGADKCVEEQAHWGKEASAVAEDLDLRRAVAWMKSWHDHFLSVTRHRVPPSLSFFIHNMNNGTFQVGPL